jgi:hypothetical protein
MSDSLPTASVRTGDGAVIFIGEEQITSLATATALNVPHGAVSMIVCPEGSDVRCAMGPAGPTATVGMPIAAGEKFPFTGDLTKFKFIAQGGTPKLNVMYFL